MFKEEVLLTNERIGIADIFQAVVIILIEVL
jgi:hypothetical protein